MDVLIQDIRYGLKQLLKSKGVTVVAIVSLAVGIGANSAIFSVFNSFLLRAARGVRARAARPDLHRRPRSPKLGCCLA